MTLHVAEPTAKREGLRIEPLAVYRVREAAECIGVSPRKMRQLVKDGKLRPQTYSRTFLFFGRDLIAFLDPASSAPTT